MNVRGISQLLIDLIGDTYYKSSIKIFAEKGKSGEVRIKKGVKQRCPSSPLLFDLAIDPLLKAVEGNPAKDEYRMQVGSENVSISIQEFADDFLVFSESNEKMNQILKILQMFRKYANIRFNPKKCQAFYPRRKSETEISNQRKSAFMAENRPR
jgi:hypothetical protein